ncbi:MAG TPA: 6-carboxytetrahydropterin synthase QueD [bacterium]|nr:6-carboxytetrahydropterin synthase QueD [bacterium]
MEIYKEFKVEAAHRLTGVCDGHPCRVLHGHTYTIVIHISGPVDTQTGMVLDFGELKKHAAPVIAQLDHHCLNDIPGLENPTSENLLRWLWRRLKPALPGLAKLVVQKTPTCGAIYCGEDE